jgi:glutathione-regulated potassium-efflux system ancillary protein KefG
MTANVINRRILILFAHPAFERSRNHRYLLAALHDVPGITIHDLYEHYPDLLINVKREQDLLTEHDVIILQHPFYWYSSPAILKEWQDLVLEHRWAYGEGGTALKGKIMLNALTTGGGRDSYQAAGFHNHSIRDFLLPFERTAVLCNMIYLAPYVLHGAHSIHEREQVAPFAAEYRKLLEALRDDRIDLARAAEAQRINDDLPSLLRVGEA